MTEKIYDWLDEMGELEKKIRDKKRLSFGDPDVVEYNRIKESFLHNFMPANREEFIQFVYKLINDYEGWLEGGIEEIREKLESQIKELETRLKDTTKTDKPYLSPQDS